jgi:hypothetical protein
MTVMFGGAIGSMMGAAMCLLALARAVVGWKGKPQGAPVGRG